MSSLPDALTVAPLQVNPDSATELALWAEALQVPHLSLHAAVYAIGSRRIADLRHWFHFAPSA